MLSTFVQQNIYILPNKVPKQKTDLDLYGQWLTNITEATEQWEQAIQLILDCRVSCTEFNCWD